MAKPKYKKGEVVELRNGVRTPCIGIVGEIIEPGAGMVMYNVVVRQRGANYRAYEHQLIPTNVNVFDMFFIIPEGQESKGFKVSAEDVKEIGRRIQVKKIRDNNLCFDCGKWKLLNANVNSTVGWCVKDGENAELTPWSGNAKACKDFVPK